MKLVPGFKKYRGYFLKQVAQRARRAGAQCLGASPARSNPGPALRQDGRFKSGPKYLFEPVLAGGSSPRGRTLPPACPADARDRAGGMLGSGRRHVGIGPAACWDRTGLFERAVTRARLPKTAQMRSKQFAGCGQKLPEQLFDPPLTDGWTAPGVPFGGREVQTIVEKLLDGSPQTASKELFDPCLTSGREGERDRSV